MRSKYRDRAAEITVQRKYKLCLEIIREAKRCVELAGNPSRLVDPYEARTTIRRKHHIRA